MSIKSELKIKKSAFSDHVPDAGKMMFSFFLMLLTTIAQGGTYYVDNVAGLDAQAGTSTGAPFEHCPGSTAATGTAASTTLLPGDTVLFHGGVTYTLGSTEYIAIPAEASYAGTSRITFESGDRAASQWGMTPMYMTDAASSTVINIFSMAAGCSNITFNGLHIANQPDVYDYGGMIGSTGTLGGNILVENCVLTNGGCNGIYATGLFNLGQNPSSFVVSNCLIQYLTEHCVFFRYGWDGVTVTNCSIHQSGTNVYGTGAGDNITFYYGGTDQDHNINIWNNQLGGSPTKGCLLLECTVSNLSFVGNYMTLTNLTAGILLNGIMTNLLFANNVWSNLTISQYEGVYRSYPDVTTVFYENMSILNDTLYANDANGAFIYLTPGAATGVSGPIFDNLTIKNCIISGVNQTLGQVPLMQINNDHANSALCVNTANFVCDNNVWNPKTTAAGYFSLIGGTGETGTGGTHYTFANWQSTYGQDLHSTTSVPVYNAGTFIPAGNDTVTRNNGINLTSSGITTDILGIGRPATGAWDIGSYQFVAYITITGVPPGTSGAATIKAVPPGTAGAIQITGQPQ